MFTLSRLITIFSVSLVLSSAVITVVGQGGGRLEGGGVATGPRTPERGSPERKAIVDALRPPTQKQLKQPVIFRIDHLKVQKGWAFVRAYPQKPDGGEIDYSNTVYQEAIDDGAFDGGVIALLKSVNGKWRVVEFVIGATDVPWVDWDKKHKAPKEIFKIE